MAGAASIMIKHAINATEVIGLCRARWCDLQSLDDDM
jgi:hypothetical protein